MSPSAAATGPKRTRPPTDVPQTPALRFRPASEVQETPVVAERMETLLACLDYTPMPHEVFARPACIVPNKRRKLDMGTPTPVADVVERHPAEHACSNNQAVGTSIAHVPNQAANGDETEAAAAPMGPEDTTADLNDMDDDLIDSQWFYSQSQPHMPVDPTPPLLSQPIRQSGAPRV